MAKTLKAAFAELGMQACGQVVAKVGFEVGDHVIAYVGSWSDYGHAQILRHDNHRKNLKEYHYCEVIEEFDCNEANPNHLLEKIFADMNAARENIANHGHAYPIWYTEE